MRIASYSARRLHIEPLEDRRLLAIFTVDNLNDAGTGSLRNTVAMANTSVGPDEIQFSVAGQISLTSGQLNVAEALTITGPGQDQLTIDANQLSRIFDITAATGDFIISGLTLTGGRTTATGLAGRGGAIRSNTGGNLTIEKSLISGNGTVADDADGGGIFAIDNLFINDSRVTGNYTLGESAFGGGIFADDDITISGSTLDGNHTKGEFSRGGAVYTEGLASIDRSTISGNFTIERGGLGGGVYSGSAVVTYTSVTANRTEGDASNGGGILAKSVLVFNNSTASGNRTLGLGADGAALWGLDAVSVTQSTVSGNSTVGQFSYGAGIWGRAVTLLRSTVTDNHGIAANAEGGGVALAFTGTSLGIRDSIVAGNTAGGAGPDIFANSVVPVVNYSLIGDTTDSNINAGSGTGNHLNQSSMLGPLSANGGVTETHAPLAGSPVIDNGDPNFSPPPVFDQRGDPFNRVVNGQIDIGAFETQPPSADFNFDNRVDGRDFIAWLTNVGTQSPNASKADGDADNDQDVDEADLVVWEMQFGTINAASVSAPATSPLVNRGAVDIAIALAMASSDDDDDDTNQAAVDMLFARFAS